MSSDELRRFVIENSDIRGEWVQLDSAWQELLKTSNYPEPAQRLLGEAAAAVCLLAATIKFEGSLVLQINGSGPMSMLVMQVTSKGQIRGLIRYAEHINPEQIESAALSELFVKGQIVISIVTEKDDERYQGIIGLQSETLALCLEDYFEQSEQIPTKIHLAANEKTAAGFMVQRLPTSDGSDDDQEAQVESWTKTASLADTLTADELLKLDVLTLLHRLYHEDDIRLFDGQEYNYHCSCSQEKIENTVRSLGRKEANDMIEESGCIEIHCEFCNTLYSLDAIDIERTFNQLISKGSGALN